MTDHFQVQPHLSLLRPDQIESTHRYALKILSETGVRVDSPSIRQLLASRIGSTMLSDDIVRFPAELVEWALKTAPSVIDVYNRRGVQAFRLGSDRHRFGMGVTSLYYQDPVTDELVKI